MYNDYYYCYCPALLLIVQAKTLWTPVDIIILL